VEPKVEDVKIRLDQAVTAKVEVISRSTAGKLVEHGLVKVNGKVQTKTSQKVGPSDIIEVDYDPTAVRHTEDIELPVIYEDTDVVVLIKPIGLLSHSKGSFNPEATVESWLHKRVPELEGERSGIVHRLDRLTSGVMICAKNPEAQKWLQKQFAQRKTKKTYIAIVAGKFKNEQAVIDMPIERNPKKPQTFRVGAKGRASQTAYKVISESTKCSLVELKPVTGRTHQLRVHLQAIGHPIIGDPLYGELKGQRLYLHAVSLELTLPNRERKVFEAKIPFAFNELMND
jgi:23S rRNA pseudouridine1911/1915/1917 synthase